MDTVVAGTPPKQARVAPRPDPLPDRTGSGWTVHAPWAGGAVLLGAGLALGRPEALGLLACGAGGTAVFLPLVAAHWRQAVRALHFAAGTLLLGLWNGAAAAGEFALGAAAVTVAALGAHAAASRIRLAEAPLAGRMPRRFGELHRRCAARFAVGGLSGALFVAVLGPSAAMKIAGIALLPLAVRSYLGQLLSAREGRAIWFFTLCVHLALLALLTPAFGAIGAAVALVGAETLLFANAALTLTRRHGGSPFTVGHFTAIVAVGLLLVTLTVPKTPEWPFLAAMAAGAAAGAIFFPRPTRDDGVWG